MGVGGVNQSQGKLQKKFLNRRRCDRSYLINLRLIGISHSDLATGHLSNVQASVSARAGSLKLSAVRHLEFAERLPRLNERRRVITVRYSRVNQFSGSSEVSRRVAHEDIREPSVFRVVKGDLGKFHVQR